ncbi:MAG: hypothetical protein LBT97_01915 [Planctomycetota bacterium]|jgi:hypothetical protein|nr:hypothetical protein [Planctomycetota bacterium]
MNKTSAKYIMPGTARKLKPKQAGRPSLGKDAKNIAVTIKITATEKREWERKAKAKGMGLREYIIHPLRNPGEQGE